MTTCPSCSRESDRLAPLLTSRLAEVDRALGLPPHALHEQRMARLAVALRALAVLERLPKPDGKEDPECPIP